MPKVSVIIPVFNGEPFIKQAIESVLEQTFNNLELIVVDDGSTDNTKAIVLSFRNQVRYIYQSNQGVSAARNTGIAAANGDYTAFLDADDVWLHRKLELQLEKFVSNPDIGLVYCSIYVVDEDLIIISEKKAVKRGKLLRNLLLLDKDMLFSGSAALIPKQIIECVGGFDTRLSTSADWEIYCRIARIAEIDFVDEPLVMYRMHGSNMHHNVDAMKHDVLLTFNDVFNDITLEPQICKLKNRCYSNLYLTLAGTYFRKHQWDRFAIYALRSLKLWPLNLLYFVCYPLRMLSRITSFRSGYSEVK